jgi:hypothetical protein
MTSFSLVDEMKIGALELLAPISDERSTVVLLIWIEGHL